MFKVLVYQYKSYIRVYSCIKHCYIALEVKV